MMDSQVDLKLIGLWQITKIPNLKAEMVGDTMNFSWSHMRKQFEIMKLPNAIFLSLEPLELRDVLEKAIVDRIGPVYDDESIRTALELAKLEGIFTGISGGASLNAALKVAQEAEPGSVLLAMLPDTGERYLSTPLLENVNEGTDADWLETL